jgi:hypothetical protein
MTAPTPLLVPGALPSANARVAAASQAIPSIVPLAAQQQVNTPSEVTLSRILSTTLSLYAVFIGGMFFAPVIPNIFYLLLYIFIVELITYVTYKAAGWSWDVTSRLSIAVASILGYLVGIGTYKLVQAYLEDQEATGGPNSQLAANNRANAALSTDQIAASQQAALKATQQVSQAGQRTVFSSLTTNPI